MECPACGKDNRDTARFCRYCATTFTLHCPVCDAELVPDSVFCDECSAPVTETRRAEPSGPARKVVTVLFADLVGSTALEERMDAESVRAILDRFYAAMRSEVERFGGRVVKFTGDGLMAAFGVPDVHEDDAARAVDAALALRTELEELASDLGLDLSLKVGINTGEVVVSGADDDVVGDAVNVASRLEGAAGPGDVLVGEDTWRLTRATSRYEPIAPLVLKGKSEPVPAYRLLSVDERTADSSTAPFVGRDVELGRLMSAFQDAVDTNSARLVTIIGSPGLGKTRLARELMSELSEQARVRETRCDPAVAQTFAPIADLLRAAMNISETDSEDEVVAKLAARLPADEPDRDRIAMRAAPILGVGLAGTTEETFWAVRRLIESAASTQPVVLVLDDLHWAEPLLLDLVEHLAEWISDAPVLLVGTARPELRDVRPSLAEGGRAAAVIALEGLDRDATAQLALNLLETDELPAELLDRIPASTEGNPLFVRELVRMLVDDGVLLRTQDGWSVTVDVDAIQVPPTIQSLLSARIDRLRSDERTVVELASVVGKEFYRGALCDLAPANVRDLVDGCLESLRRKELVEPVGTYWIDEPVYRFHHVLIRDAVYRRLLKESRAELHARVADWLEAKTADVLGEHDEVVGYHVEQAHEHKRQLGRDDDELGRRAADLLGTAAKRALDRDDLPAAAALSGRALERLPAADDASRSELLLIRCEALLSMREIAQGSAAAAEFERLASTPRLRAWATCFSGHLAILTSPERLEETEATVAVAAAELSALGDEAGAAKAHTVRASALGTRGLFAESEAVLDAALSAARAANDRRRITATLGMAPHAALWGPNPVSRAGGRCLDIVRLLRITTGSQAVEATSLRCQAVLEAFRGRADAARRMLRSARRTLTDLGLQRDVLETDQFAGIVEIVSGNPADALPHLRASYEGCRTFGVDILAAQSAALLARAHLALGETDDAEAFVAVGEELGGKDLKTSIDGWSVKAELLARRGASDEARAVAESAVALAERTDALFDQGNAYRSLARVLRTAGDAAGAKAAEDRAFALFERKGATALIEGARTDTAPSVATPSAPTEGPLLNACARATEVVLDRFNSGDLSGVRALMAESGRYDDRRRVLAQESVIGREALIDTWRGAVDVGMTGATSRWLATRGERSALAHVTFTGPRFDWQMLAILELGDDGLVSRVVVFDADNLGAAFAELDQRYIAGEGNTCAAPFARFDDLMRELNERNWAGVEAIFLPDAKIDDRTPASRGEMSIDRFLESFRELVELTTELCVRTVAVHAAAENAIVVEAHNRGVSVQGADVDLAYQVVVVLRGDRIARLELFPVERLDLAVQRFDALTASQAPDGELANRCTRVKAEYMDAFNRRDFDRARALLAELASFDDRRSVMRTVVSGREAIIEHLQTIANLAPARVSHEVLATRGERLALVRNRWRSEDDADEFAIETLIVAEIDEDDRYSLAVTFDVNDLEAAFADLEARYIAGEGAPFASTLEVVRNQYDAWNRGDLTSYRATYHQDIVVEDHRPASLGRVSGVDEIVSATWTLQELVPGYKRYIESYHALDADRFVIRALLTGTTKDGGAVDAETLTVGTLRDGRGASYDLYPIDQLEAALARYESLGSRTTGALDNLAIQATRRMVHAFLSDDWRYFDTAFSPDNEYSDHRLGVRTVVRGPDEARNNLRTMRDLHVERWAFTPLATRGDRLVLYRHIVEGPPESGFTVEALVVQEVDGSGRLSWSRSLDPSDFDEALTALDERYIALEGSADPDLVRLVREFARAYTARDIERLRSLFTDDFVSVDHRAASSGTLDREGLLAWLGAAYELTEQATAHVVTIHAITSGRALVRFEVRGTTNEGGIYETALHLIMERRGDRIARAEQFALEQLDLAAQRFEELGRAQRELDNRSMDVLRDVVSCVGRGDWEAFVRLYTSRSVIEDRRRGLRATVTGPDEILEFGKTQRDAFGTRDYTCIATRGDRLALARGTWETSDGSYDAEVLRLAEIDEGAHVIATIFFDPEDVDAAFAELDERYASGEGAHGARVIGIYGDFNGAYNARDWDALRALATDDFTLVDHRLASLGTIGPDEYVRAMRTLVELIPGRMGRVLAVPALSERACVTRWESSGHTADGAAIDETFYIVFLLRGDRVVRHEIFPDSRLDDALQRFDELERPAVGPPRNRCARLLDEAMERYERSPREGLSDFFDWLRSRLSDASTHEDRRSGLGSISVGADAVIERNSVMPRPASEVRRSLLATRGECLALMQIAFVGGEDGFETEMLWLAELDEDDRYAATVTFDADDWDGAFAELGERWVTREGRGALGSLARMTQQLAAAANERDWAAYDKLLADDLVAIDHRPVSLGERYGREAEVESMRAMTEVIPDLRYYALGAHAYDHGGTVSEILAKGTSSGGPVELTFVGVYLLRGDVISHLEIFPLDELDAALARFDELGRGSEPLGPRLENACTRNWVRLSECFVERNWTGYSGLLSDDIGFEDRRAGLGVRARGPEVFIEQVKVIADMGAAQKTEVVATRGNAAALLRIEWYDPRGGTGSPTVPTFHVHEVDDEERLVTSIVFDVDDLDAAFNELDDRYIAGEGTPFASLLRTSRDLTKAHREKDWERWRSLFVDDVEVIDHRPASWGTIRGIEAWMGHSRAVVDVVSDVRFHNVAIHAIAEDRVLRELSMTGVNAEGGPIELRHHVLACHSAGKTTRMEIFDLNRLDDALARFNELGSRTRDASYDVPETTAVRWQRRIHELWRSDWDAYAALYAEDTIYEDRRRGLRHRDEGRANVIAHMRVASTGTDVRSVPIATRGDRLVLERNTATMRDGFEVEVLSVHEVNEQGEVQATVLFDDDALDAAFAELDARYAAGEGGPYAGPVLAEAALCQTLNKRDWEAFRALFTDDFALVDHRPASLGTVDADGWLAAQEAKIELVPTYLGYPFYYHGLTADTWWVQVHARATTDYDTDVDFSVQSVGQVRDGRIVRLDTFLDSQTDDARALFESLSRSASFLSLANEATRAVERFFDAFRRRDWPALAGVLHDDGVRDDRRQGLGGIAGKDAVIEGWTAMADLGFEQTTFDHIATRGERLSLSRGFVKGSHGFESEAVVINETDGAGCIVSSIYFDATGLDAAFDELDLRFLASDEVPESYRWQLESGRAYNARDWDRYRAMLTDGFVFVDRRAVSAGTIVGADDATVHRKALIDLVPDARVEVRRAIRCASNVGLMWLWIHGTDENGSRVEYEHLVIPVLESGLSARSEVFPVTDVDAAIARFDELSK